jgi:YegS/Rv2252/BmrU family lipid kinase
MRTTSFQTVLIVNPRSANGKTGRRWPTIEGIVHKEFRGRFDVVFTERPLHATTVTRQHLDRGYNLVVAVGGDGLVNEVVNGFFEGGQNLHPEAVLGLLPAGSASDFVKSLGWDRDLPEAVRRLNGTRTSRVDVGRATFRDFQGEKKTRCFLNVADFGAGGAVVEKVNHTSKIFGGALTFLWGILSTLPQYRNTQIHLTMDGGEEVSAMLNNVIVANGKYYGGCIKAAPDASIDDGHFQFVVVGDVTFSEVLWNLPRFLRGTHLTHPKVQSLHGRRLRATSRERVFIETDGELVGTLPGVFDILPGALLIKVSDE